MKSTIMKGRVKKSDGYFPDSENMLKPHIVVAELNNGMSAFSEVFPTYHLANECQYIWRCEGNGSDFTPDMIVETYTIPLFDVPNIFGRFSGKTDEDMVAILGGRLNANKSAKKSKKMKKAQSVVSMAYTRGGTTVEIPDTIECNGGTLRYKGGNGSGSAIYEGKIRDFYIVAMFWVVSETKGDELDIFGDTSKSRVESEGYIDPITGTEDIFKLSEIPEYVDIAVDYLRKIRSGTFSTKKSRVIGKEYRSGMKEDYGDARFHFIDNGSEYDMYVTIEADDPNNMFGHEYGVITPYFIRYDRINDENYRREQAMNYLNDIRNGINVGHLDDIKTLREKLRGKSAKKMKKSNSIRKGPGAGVSFKSEDLSIDSYDLNSGRIVINVGYTDFRAYYWGGTATQGGYIIVNIDTNPAKIFDTNENSVYYGGYWADIDETYNPANVTDISIIRAEGKFDGVIGGGWSHTELHLGEVYDVGDRELGDIAIVFHGKYNGRDIWSDVYLAYTDGKWEMSDEFVDAYTEEAEAWFNPVDYDDDDEPVEIDEGEDALYHASTKKSKVKKYYETVRDNYKGFRIARANGIYYAMGIQGVFEGMELTDSDPHSLMQQIDGIRRSFGVKRNVAKNYHQTWLDDDYVVCCKSNDPVLSVILEEEHYCYNTEDEARAEGIRLYESGEYKDIELYHGKEKLVGADEWAGMTKSRKVKKDMDVLGEYDDYRQEQNGRKYVMHLNLNGDSFYPKYYADEESFNRAVQQAIDRGYTESDYSNYTETDGSVHRHFWKDASTKKSYAPDYKDFKSMVKSMRDTKDNKKVFKE